MTEAALRRNEDYDWCLSQTELYEKYGGQVVVVYNKQVIAHGADHLLALENAQMRLAEMPEAERPDRWDLSFVVLGHSWYFSPHFPKGAE